MKVEGPKGDAKHDQEGNETDDPKFREFLEAMKPRAKSKLWSDDTPLPTVPNQNGKVGKKVSQTEKGSKEKLGTLDVETKESATEKLNIVNNEVMSDTDYLKSKMKKNWSDSDSDDDLEGEGHGDEKVSHSPNERLDANDGMVEDEPTVVNEEDGKSLVS